MRDCRVTSDPKTAVAKSAVRGNMWRERHPVPGAARRWRGQRGHSCERHAPAYRGHAGSSKPRAAKPAALSNAACPEVDRRERKLQHSCPPTRGASCLGDAGSGSPAQPMSDAPSLVVAAWPVVRHWPSDFKEQVPADQRVKWPAKALAASLLLMAVAANVAAMVTSRQGAYAAAPEGLAVAARSWLVSARNASHAEATAALEDAWAHINRRETWYYAGIAIAAPGVAMVLVNSSMFWTSLDLQARAR